MNRLLEGTKAIVTGGTAGIGKAAVVTLAKAGATVAFLGTNAERGAEVTSLVKQETGEDRAHFYAADVSNTNATEEIIKKIITDLGGVDILVNNAGITRDGLLMQMKEEDWDRVLDVNVKSCYNTCRAVIRPMMKARKGKIINISSIVGITGNPGQTNYAASKAAMIGFTKALAKEVASRNICVNCVAPGFIETAMTDFLNEAQKTKINAEIPLGRIGNPEEVANAILFLASPLSDYVTGEVLTVAGGMGM